MRPLNSCFFPRASASRRPATSQEGKGAGWICGRSSPAKGKWEMPARPRLAPLPTRPATLPFAILCPRQLGFPPGKFCLAVLFRQSKCRPPHGIWPGRRRMELHRTNYRCPRSSPRFKHSKPINETSGRPIQNSDGGANSNGAPPNPNDSLLAEWPLALFQLSPTQWVPIYSGKLRGLNTTEAFRLH